ncbi:LOW QUALITY PROTEIN: transmembrane protein 87A [Drosophila eugracilis]|uniref:LOW QUALITY PROTEIN: transmembrane protein 87A n=1 Tax=Drosophila eugracilis TaxID=29029 RepID=UPI0007E6341F|nr:LOW QUALITY PROTEIN: transmembrane protein 87A [Drosophila eugracilis]
MKGKATLLVVALALLFGPSNTIGKSDPGIVDILVTTTFPSIREQRPLLANTKIYAQIKGCTPNGETNLTVTFRLTEHPCIFDDLQLQTIAHDSALLNNASINNKIFELTNTYPCNGLIVLAINKDKPAEGATPGTPEPKHPMLEHKHPLSPTTNPVASVDKDGIYEIEVIIAPQSPQFSAVVHIEFLGPHGYISAIDWPFLPFYLIMCIVYVIFGIIWLFVSFAQWRDLLRIQFWIGGVILLGMLEKAFFYAEYQTLTNKGVPVQHAELVAEFVSCAKRTLARMLVIIMSLGFGIVKPRLGPMLHRVVGVGTLYFVLACVESYLRITNIKTDRSELLVASIPLAVLDTGICWWIFTSLVQTTRTLRLRRNMVKLSLYRHFTNTLIFAVIASVIFMLFALHLRSIENCTPGWRDIWVDTGFWHILFSVLLLVIMILWRPTNNNQRYAFTPLLDNPEDEDDEDEEDQFVADAYGVKMRGQNGTPKTSTASRNATTTEEDDLRWVEENIPSSMADSALPILDSDEEIINTKFEVSKMQ